jgi:hypothetical protein
MITLPILATLLLAPQKAPDEKPFGAAYNVTLVTDNAPDFTDIDAYLRSITSQFKEPQDQAIAIWRWAQRLRKQTTYPVEEGHTVFDPIAFFPSYGYCNCGIVSGLNDTMWLRMGWKARYVQLGDHTVCECSWDGGASWHMFDASMSIYVFNDRGQVASTTEIEKNPRFYLEQYAPECGTHPNGWRSSCDRPVAYDRTLANGVDSFKAPNSLQEGNLHAQWGRRYVLNLRPFEHYTRHFDNLDPAAPSNPRHFRPVRVNQDVEKQHGHQNIRGNGVWRFAPDLRHPRARELAHAESGVTWDSKGVRPAKADAPGTVTFKVNAANVVTSAAARLAARRGAGDSVALSVSRTAGITWAAVENIEGEIDLMPHVAGATEYLLRAELRGPGAALESLEVETVTQLNRSALPRLARGANRVQLRLGAQVETVQFQPSVVDGRHKATAHEEKGVDVEPKPDFYKPTIRPAEAGTPCHVTWKIETPGPVTEAVYGGTVCVKNDRDRVTLLHSWDGKDYAKDWEKADGTPPYDLCVNAPAGKVPPDAQAAFLRYEFQTTHAPRSYSGPGLQTVWMRVNHEPRLKGAVPLEVTYCWVEHRKDGDVERRHTEIVTAPEHEYVLHVAGYRDPTMKWVRVNLKGHGPEPAKPGYSDGQDVGPGAEPERVRYAWGTNLARGRKYALEGATSEKNPDAGGDLTDGAIAPPEDHVSVKYMPTNVIFAADVSPVVTIDLEEEKEVAAVRVHAGQEGGFRVAFPDTITVETSLDGKAFRRAGAVGHDQVFDPPADYVPWEFHDAAQYASLPAGGILAYGYRVIFDKPVKARHLRVTCACRKGWGVMLSEILAFDRVTLDRTMPPLVVLPAIRKPR